MDWDQECNDRRKEQSHERIAVLETQVKGLKKDLDIIQGQLDSILAELIRYKGFLGGITFIISGVILAWQFVGEWVKRNL